jgi:hypothetical protein
MTERIVTADVEETGLQDAPYRLVFRNHVGILASIPVASIEEADALAKEMVEQFGLKNVETGVVPSVRSESNEDDAAS